jgi:hypothetical protein
VRVRDLSYLIYQGEVNIWGSRGCLEAEVLDAALVPAEVVRELVAEGALHLVAQEVGVVPEVALERVLIDHDPVRIVVARNGVAEVVTVGAVLGAEL